MTAVDKRTDQASAWGCWVTFRQKPCRCSAAIAAPTSWSSGADPAIALHGRIGQLIGFFARVLPRVVEYRYGRDLSYWIVWSLLLLDFHLVKFRRVWFVSHSRGLRAVEGDIALSGMWVDICTLPNIQVEYV